MATNLNTILSWFMTGKKPTQAQFWASWSSFWHKDETIPQSSISGLTTVLNAKTENDQFNAHKTDENAHSDLFESKEDKNQKGVSGGYVPLNEFAKIASQYLEVINDLYSGGVEKMLSAEQGKLLQTQINNINIILASDNVNLDNVQELVDAIETIQMSLSTILVNDLVTGGTTKALTAEMGKQLDLLKESVSNKSQDIEVDKFSALKYGSVKAVYNWAIGLFAFKNSPNLTGTPTAPTAPTGTSTNQIATTAFVLANAGGIVPVRPAVSFSFDDSFISQYALASDFESRGVRFSQGTTVSFIGTSTKMTLAQIANLESRGFEVLNHTATHTDMRDGTATTYAEAFTEIKGAHDSLIGMGLSPKGFVSPFSAIKREFLPIVDNIYKSAYTIRLGEAAGASDPDIQVMVSPIHSTRMNRASMYEHTVVQCKAIIDKALETNGIVSFYDHDPGGLYYSTSASKADILNILDYAISVVGVNNIIKVSDIPSRFNSVSNGGGVYAVITEGLVVPNQVFTTASLSFATESKDIKAMTDGTFIIKTPGVYNFETACTYLSTAATRTLTAIEIDGTGTFRNRHNGFASGLGASLAYNGINFPTLTLVKGQKVKIKLFQDSGASNSIVGGEPYNFIKVTKLTN